MATHKYLEYENLKVLCKFIEMKLEKMRNISEISSDLYSELESADYTFMNLSKNLEELKEFNVKNPDLSSRLIDDGYEEENEQMVSEDELSILNRIFGEYEEAFDCFSTSMDDRISVLESFLEKYEEKLEKLENNKPLEDED